jgi:eukaryotic-like serine/threonine-protein kinase
MPDSLRVLEGNLVLGRYRVVKPLARGGMGMVYLGRVEGAAGFAKPVVIKRVLSQMDDGEASRAQFIREARILSSLQHANIVGVIDFAQEGDSYLMILEYVHGYHLGHWLKYVKKARGLVKWDWAVYVIIKVLAALHYAHTNQGSDGKPREIIHRDISPGNVLIDLEGNIRLLDFGIAVEKDETNEHKTQDGVVKGKLPYIAPEMYRSAEASVSSDVYAAAVVLYQLLSGANPFSDKDMSSIVRKVLELTPASLSSLRDDVPPMLDEVIARGLAKNPEERYANAQEFSFALHALLERPEGEIASEFRDAVRADFTGDMAQMLQLEELSSLDAAWRSAIGAEDDTSRGLLRSSLPPRPDNDATAVVRTPRNRAHLTQDTLIEGTPQVQVSVGPGKALSGRSMILGMLGAALLAAGIAVGVILITRPSDTSPREPRFLLVERPGQGSAAAATEQSPTVTATGSSPMADTPNVEPTMEPTLATAKPSPSQAPKAGPSPAGASSVAALNQAFAQRSGALQNCFQKNTEGLSGSPQVTIKFRVGTAGNVESASLQPESLAGTALGSCVLGVARTTKFPPQENPVAFSIPFQASIAR